MLRLKQAGSAATLTLAAALCLSVLMPGKAMAICYTPCIALGEGPIDNMTQVDELYDYDSDKHETLRDNVNEHTDEQFEQHKQDFMIEKVWDEWLRPNLQMLTEQVTSVAIQQMEVIGAFLDAKHQLETQRLFQQMAADAYKDYTPSEGLCTIASMSRSLGGSERNYEMASAVLSARSLSRQLLKSNSSASEGGVSDRESRFVQFQKRYCDRDDNTAGLAAVCQHDAAVPLDILNKDISFFRTVGRPVNIDINFASTTGNASSDQNDVFALQSNLYAHNLPETLQKGVMSQGSEQKKDTGEQKYMDMRSIIAQRSVAENSFNEIAALKAQGQTSVAMTATYMRAALQEMGISAADATRLLGENPSYYAQMEVLTRRMFQRPEFFVDLYDKPANVERKSVALQAISVMQRRDIFKSQLRIESMISLLLELEAAHQQETAQNVSAGIK
ncbi:MAG: hypothetical protein JWO78_2370 [Micavibrio sp.]|nr:hypothetical protein [Micavibrio sp.]